MGRAVMKQALTAMGYRKMGEKESGDDAGLYYGKPVGFALLLAKITTDNKVTILTTFKSTKGDSLCWGRHTIVFSQEQEEDLKEMGEELYKCYCYKIAWAEIEANTDKVTNCSHAAEETYAFSTDYDIYQII